MHICIISLSLNLQTKFFIFFTFLETTFQPAAPEPGDLSKKLLNISDLLPKSKLLSQIT